MVEMINRVMGTKMLVADDRVDSYLAAGHKLAASKPEPKPEKEPEKKPKKAKK